MAHAASQVSPRPPQPGQLFSPLKFWVSQHVPNRSELVKNLSMNGGQMVAIEARADYCLVNPTAKMRFTTANCYSYEFVKDSLHINQLQDPDEYHVLPQPPADRPVGSASAPQKGTRTPFTSEDDQILEAWIVPFMKRGGKWKGNQIYQQMAREYPHHTYQSWRERALQRFKPRESLIISRTSDGHDQQEATVIGDERPSKRRRVQTSTRVTFVEDKLEVSNSKRQSQDPEPESRSEISQRTQHRPPRIDGVLDRSDLTPGIMAQPAGAEVDLDQVDPRGQVPGGQRMQTPVETTENDGTLQEIQSQDVEIDPRSASRQSLLTKRFTKMSATTRGFSLDEARRLYKAVPDICNVSPNRLKSCWANVAGAWTGHTAEEWQLYYEHEILPEYKRRNGLKSDMELEQYVKHVLTREHEDDNVEIKREATPDFRSPQQKQIDREAERAQAETNDIAMSDISETGQRGSQNLPESQGQLQAGSRPQSPIVSRPEVQANEGRKRASQQINSTQSTSQNVEDEQIATPSQKKKLFGRILDLSPSASRQVIQLERVNATTDARPPVTRQSGSEAIANTNQISSSASSVPAAQKPPQSYQPPSASASTSQDSALYDTAKQSQPAVAPNTGTSGSAVHNEEIAEQEALSRNSPAIDLIGDGEPDLDETNSQGALSDTGSEYMAFDTAPQRSQLWESPEDASNEQETDEEGDTFHADGRGVPIRSSTPVRRRALSEQTVEDNAGSDISPVVSRSNAGEIRFEEEASDGAGRRVETQALFKQPTENEVSEFDLPAPEGGWEALGLESLDDEQQDPDTPLQTVEAPDRNEVTRVISPSLSETSDSSYKSDDQPVNPISQPAPAQVVVSSDGSDQTVSETEEQSATPTAKSESKRKSTSRFTAKSISRVGNHSARRRRSSIDSSSDSASSDKFSDNELILAWMKLQRERYLDLPSLVCNRLAKTAMQATTINKISAATVLLRRLVEAFWASESDRQERSSRRRSSFKAKRTLTDLEAKAFIPDGTQGVWTSADDDSLISGTLASIQRVEAKHTKAGVERRKQWLRFHFKLKGPSGRAESVSSSIGDRIPIVSAARRSGRS